MQGGKEVSFGFVMPGSDGPELFEVGKEVLDPVPFGVQALVQRSWLEPGRARRDHGRFAGLGKRIEHPGTGVKAVSAMTTGARMVLSKASAPWQFRGLAGGQVHRRGPALGVDHGVDLGAQPTLAAADGLIPGVSAAPFLRAPVLCWWARTMVASIMANSSSAFWDRWANNLCQIPRLAQRVKRVCTTRKSPKRSGWSRHGVPAR